MKSRYDQYRPNYALRPVATRRETGDTDRSESRFWRRDETEDRRGRRASAEIVGTDREQVRSPIASDVPTGPRSTTITSTRRPSLNIATRPVNLSRRASAAIQPSSSTSTLRNPFASPPRPGQDLIQQTSTAMASIASPNKVVKSADPRLQSQARQQTVVPGKAISPILPSTDLVKDSYDQSYLIRQLTDIAISRNEMDHRLRALQVKLQEQKTNLESASKMFNATNPYIQSLKDEALATEKAYKTKEVKLSELKRQEDLAMRALAAQTKSQEVLMVDMQQLKTDLEEERAQSTQLKSTNDEFQKQISQLQKTVNELGIRFDQQNSGPNTKVEDQLTELKSLAQKSLADVDFIRNSAKEDRQTIIELQNRLSSLGEKNTDALREELAAQKLEVVRIKNNFATQETLTSLSSRVNDLKSQTLSILNKSQGASSSPPAPFAPATKAPSPEVSKPASQAITQANLDSYVAVFNAFEAKIDQRLAKLEEQEVARTIADANSAEVEQSILKDVVSNSRSIIALQGGLKDISSRLGIVESASRTLVQTETAQKLGNENIHQSIRSVSQKNDELLQRLKSLETARQGTHGMTAPAQDYQKTLLDVAHLQKICQRLEKVTMSNSFGVDSLNQRFNNLSSERLARQMIAVLDPILATIKPQLAVIKNQIEQLKTVQPQASEKLAMLETQLSELKKTTENIENVDADLAVRLRSAEIYLQGISKDPSTKMLSEDLRSAEQSIIDLEKSQEHITNTVSEKVDAASKSIQITFETRMKEEAEATKASNTIALVEAKETQQAEFLKLVDQVKEARDSIDARLVIVEQRQSDRSRAIAPPSTSQSKQVTQQVGTPISANSSIKPSSSNRSMDASVPQAALPKPAVSTPTSSPQTSSSKPLVSAPSASSQPRSNMSSKARQSKSKLSQSSSVAKHFIPRSTLDYNDEDDTIDATPKGSVHESKVRHMSDVITIPDSEQESNADDSDQFHDPLSLSPDAASREAIDWQKWQKSSTTSGSKYSVPTKTGNTNTHQNSAANSVKNGSVKRKRELSDGTLKSSQNSMASRSSSPHGKKKKKKKV